MSDVAASGTEVPVTPDLLQEQFASLMKNLAEKAKSVKAYEFNGKAELPHKFGHFTFRDLAFPDQLEPIAHVMVNLLSGEVAKKGRVIGIDERDYEMAFEDEQKKANEFAESNLKYMGGAIVTENDGKMRLSLYGHEQKIDFILDKATGQVQLGLAVNNDEFATKGNESGLTDALKNNAFSAAVKFCGEQLDALGNDFGQIAFREYESPPQATE